MAKKEERRWVNKAAKTEKEKHNGPNSRPNYELIQFMRASFLAASRIIVE
jgi:hypothetical protein